MLKNVSIGLFVLGILIIVANLFYFNASILLSGFGFMLIGCAGFIIYNLFQLGKVTVEYINDPENQKIWEESVEKAKKDFDKHQKERHDPEGVR